MKTILRKNTFPFECRVENRKKFLGLHADSNPQPMAPRYSSVATQPLGGRLENNKQSI